MLPFAAGMKDREQGDQMSLWKKNRPKCRPTNFYLSQLKHNFNRVKKVTRKFGMLPSFKKAQSKLSPNGRKLAQSGHPDQERSAEAWNTNSGRG
jgi:hypothetical protein